MDNNMKFWQKSAKLYTPMQEKQNGHLYRTLCEKSKKYISGRTVLELACGTGQMTAPLSSLASLWEATDFSENMIEEAKKRDIPNAAFSVQDATNLPYADESFDVVIIANALHVMPDPVKAMGEIKRVLKKHGILIAPTFVYGGKCNKLRLFLVSTFGFKTFNKWTKETYPKFIEDNGFTVKQTALVSGNPLHCMFIAAMK